MFTDCDLWDARGKRLTTPFFYAMNGSPQNEGEVVLKVEEFGVRTLYPNPFDCMGREDIEKLEPGEYRFRLTVLTPKRAPAVSNWLSFKVTAADIRAHKDDPFGRDVSDLWLKRRP